MTNEPTLKDYARRMRPLLEGQMQFAADLRELAKEMRETGFQAVVLKAWVKAAISYEDGDEGPLDRLKARIDDAALYGAVLGFCDGETKHNLINESPRGDGDGPETGGSGDRIVASDETGERISRERFEMRASPTNQKAAPDPNHSPDTSDGDPTRKDGCSGGRLPVPCAKCTTGIQPRH